MRTGELQENIRDLEAAVADRDAAMAEAETGYRLHLERSRAEADKAARAAQTQAMAPLKAELERMKARKTCYVYP